MAPDPRSSSNGAPASERDTHAAILGRVDEQRAVDGVLDAARRGSSSVLVLRGEAGMGKTTLLDYAIRSASDMTIMSIAGVQSESEFGFGALQRLLIPFMDHTSVLPERQRDAIGTALGTFNGPPPDRFIVGLAALTVLADAAGDRPLLCVIDDSQWLDGESLDALGLIGRRLFAEGIAMLFGVRTSQYPPVPSTGCRRSTSLDCRSTPRSSSSTRS